MSAQTPVVNTYKMGLDSVEIVMKVEQAFGINIPDVDAEKLRTVGDMYEYVSARVTDVSTNACVTQKLFYKLRKHFREQLEIPEDFVIIPSTKLKELIPEEGRKHKWVQLEKSIGLSLPALQIPPPVNIIRAVLFCLVVYFSYEDTFGLSELIGTKNKLVLLLPVLPMILINMIISRISKNEFATTDMRGLSLKVLELNFEELSKEGVSQKEVQQIIKNILADIAGIDPKKISPEKSFVYDLGIN